MNMKAKFLVLLLAVIFVSCEKDKDCPNPENCNCDTTIYPVIIPYNYYSLEEYSQEWVNFPNKNSIIVINSDEELEKYVICNDRPPINFSENSLLFIAFPTIKLANNGIENIELLKYPKNQYSLYLTVRYTYFTGLGKPCYTCILTPKIANEAEMALFIRFSPFYQ